MANKRDFNVGYFQINSVFIENYDKTKELEISNLISYFEIIESIDTVAMTAKFVMVDAVDLIDTFPVIGEETVVMEYEDFYGNELELTFSVQSIERMETNDQGNLLTYLMTLYSPEFFKSETTDIQRSFRGTNSEIAKTIYDQYIDSDRPFDDIEQTDTEQLYVIPSMTPFDAITFLARKAYSVENPSSDFYFYETREGFHFKTSEKMIQDSNRQLESFNTRNIYKYDPALLTDLSKKAESMQNIQSFSVARRFNKLERIRNGTMINEFIELDVLNQSSNTEIFKYEDGDFTHTDLFSRPIHSDEFINEFYSEDNIRKTMLAIKDDGRPEQNYSLITGPRLSYKSKLNEITVSCNIYGRNDLFPGDVILLQIPEMVGKTTARDAHPSMSGYYLIKRMRHVMEEQIYTCELTLVKDTLKGELG